MNILEKIWIYFGFNLALATLFIILLINVGETPTEAINLSRRMPFLASIFTMLFIADVGYSLLKEASIEFKIIKDIFHIKKKENKQ